MRSRAERNWQGAILTEALVALALLGTLISVVGQATARITRQATLSRERLVAMEILTNQMGRACALIQADTQPGIQALELPDAAQRDLPDSSCSCEFKELDRGWHVTVTLHWVNSLNSNPLAASMASWVPRATAAGTERGEPTS